MIAFVVTTVSNQKSLTAREGRNCASLHHSYVLPAIDPRLR